MFIEPIQCSRCGNSGRPDEKGFNYANRQFIQCECGNEIWQIHMQRDQEILSGNSFVRFGSASNHEERGHFPLPPGRCGYVERVTFKKSFEYIGFVTLNAGGGPIYVKESDLSPEGMTILTCLDQDYTYKEGEPLLAIWSVHGLVDVDSLPAWWLFFYNGMSQSQNRIYKPALMDYAVAFEVFLESFLRERLTQKYGQDIAEYLLNREWRIDERCKNILELAIGHKLTERDDVYQPWYVNVHQPRNDLAHGKSRVVGKQDVENAHLAVYQAVRWIETVSS